MSRPTDKQTLISQNTDSFNKLLRLINNLSQEQQLATFPFNNNRDRNIRDIVTRLHEWHLMVIDWYQHDRLSNKSIVNKRGYTWQSLPNLNQLIWEKYQTTPLDIALKKLTESHQQIHALIDSLNEEKLFINKYYPRIYITILGAYLIASTYNHYDWAIRRLKGYKRSIIKQLI